LKKYKKFGNIILGDGMNILAKNTNIIHRLYMDYPENLKGISVEGNDLVLNGSQRVDISKYDIATLLDGENPFFDEIQDLTPQDIFRIIRLHVMYLDSKNTNEGGEPNDN
jgi:hypothetical protein